MINFKDFALAKEASDKANISIANYSMLVCNEDYKHKFLESEDYFNFSGTILLRKNNKKNNIKYINDSLELCTSLKDLVPANYLKDFNFTDRDIMLLGENVNISGKKFVKLAPEYRKIYNKLWYKMNAKELSEFIKEDGKIDYKQISQDSFLLYY